MNKKELVSKVAKDTGVTMKQAAAAVDSVLDGIVSSVADGEGFSIVGFGSFKKQYVPARQAINPSTKEKIEVKAHSKVVFKAGKPFKEKIQ